MRLRLSFLIILVLSVAASRAQPVLTPSPDRTGSSTGADLGPYTVTNSFETGYRFTTVGGEQSLFRSAENYGNGVRLFGGSLTMTSKDGRGRYFDSLLLTTSGLGNDPYGLANLTIDKNNRYRYNGTWRRSEYYNPSLINGASATLKNTRRTMQDHDLTVSVSRWAALALGYSRVQESGPNFTTYEAYIGGLARGGLPLARDVRRDFNEYRLGSEFDVIGFRISLSHRWEYYKDDSSIASLIPGQPYAADFLRQRPFDPTLGVTYPQIVTAYSRSEPMRTSRSGWFGNISRTAKYWTVNARMTYSKGDSSTFYYENQSGASQAPAVVPTGDGRFLTSNNSGYGPQINAFTSMPGSARQPFTAGDFSFSVFPTSRLTLTANTSVNHVRYDGTGSELRVLSNGAAVINRFWTYQIAIGRVTSGLEANYRVNNKLSVVADYRYTQRFLDNNLIRTGTTNSRDFNSTSNHLNQGTIGVRLKPVKAFTLSLDSGVGRDTLPNTPTSPARFHNVRARADYRLQRARFGATYRQVYNITAPLPLTLGAPPDYYSSQSRELSANTSFDATKHLSFDVAYTKAHWNSFANLWANLVPANSTTVNSVGTLGYYSQFISNVHTVSLMTRATAGRATFYAGYNLSRDNGDGRNQQNLGLTNLASAYTAAWSTFPMQYQAPLARLSFRLSPNLQWNAGWQFYRYNQRFAYYGYQPYYRAHTGYTSVTYTFGAVPAQTETTPKSKEKKQ